MTKRENMLTAFRHQKPDYVPVVCSCDNYNRPQPASVPPALAERLGEPSGPGTSAIELSRWFDLELFSRVRPPIRSRHPNCTVETATVGDTRLTTWTTPCGRLRQRVNRATPDSPAYTEERLVKGPEDLDALAAMFADEQFELDPAQVHAVAERRALVGEDGVTIINLPGTPLGMMVRVYSGVEALAYLTVDCPEQLAQLLNAMGDNYLRRLKLLETVEADGVWSVDDTSTTAISPRMFERYAVPYINRAATEAQRQNKLYIHHSCGLIRDLLELYRQTKMDVVQALCPPPVGDAPLRESKQRLGPGITMMPALVELADPGFTQAKARESVARAFAEVAPGDNVIFGVAPFPDRTFDDLACVVETCKAHRAY